MTVYDSKPTTRVIQFIGASNPLNWPRSPSDKVSIFEAIKIVGQAKFGSAWDGTEFDVVKWPISPKDALADQLHRTSFVSRAPSPIKPISQSLYPPEVSRERPKPKPAIQFDAHLAVWRLEEGQRQWNANQAACSRLREVSEWIAQRCRDGELPSFARLRVSGDIWPMSVGEWNVANVIDRFVSEGGNKRYFPEYDMSRSAYIFFNRCDVDRATATLSYVPTLVAERDLASLSPFLRLAVQIALANGYTAPDKSETNPIRQAEIKSKWDEAYPNVPLSSTMCERIAYVMGFPDAIAVQQGQSAHRKRVPPHK